MCDCDSFINEYINFKNESGTFVGGSEGLTGEFSLARFMGGDPNTGKALDTVGNVSNELEKLLSMIPPTVQDKINLETNVEQNIQDFLDKGKEYSMKNAKIFTDQIHTAIKKNVNDDPKLMNALTDQLKKVSVVLSANINGPMGKQLDSNVSAFIGGSYSTLKGAAELSMQHVKEIIISIQLLMSLTHSINKSVSDSKFKSKDAKELANKYKKINARIESEYKKLRSLYEKEFKEMRIPKSVEALEGKSIDDIKKYLESNDDIHRSVRVEFLKALKEIYPLLGHTTKLNKHLKELKISMSEYEKAMKDNKIEELVQHVADNLDNLSPSERGKAKKALKYIIGTFGLDTNFDKFEGADEMPVESPVDVMSFETQQFEGGEGNLFISDNMLDGSSGDVSFIGGKTALLELERTVKELQPDGTLDLLKSKQAVQFREEHNKKITELFRASKEAATSMKSDIKDIDAVNDFIVKLSFLKTINVDELVAQYSGDKSKSGQVLYAKEYFRMNLYSPLEDIVKAAKKVSSDIPKIGVFVKALESYIDFVKSYEKKMDKSVDVRKQLHAREDLFVGGNNTDVMGGTGNNISTTDIMGGLETIALNDIVDLFDKGVVVGQMKKGLNLAMSELDKYEENQSEMTRRVVGKEIEKLAEEFTKMIDNYEERDNFPIKKQMFAHVLNKNIEGFECLKRAAQGLDEMVRFYQLKVVKNHSEAKKIIELVKQISVDANWLPESFNGLSEFPKYFQIETLPTNEALEVLYKNPGDGKENKHTANNTKINPPAAVPPANIRPTKEALSPYIYNLHVDNIERHSAATLIVVYSEKDAANNTIQKPSTKDIEKVHNYICNTLDKVNAYGGTKANPSPDAAIELKFLSKEEQKAMYDRALAILMRESRKIGAMKNLFSIFERIDRAYNKESGKPRTKTSMNVGSIYENLQKYLVYTAMYPIIYKIGDKYTASHIGLRHFGHDIAYPAGGVKDMTLHNYYRLMSQNAITLDMGEAQHNVDWTHDQKSDLQDPFMSKGYKYGDTENPAGTQKEAKPKKDTDWESLTKDRYFAEQFYNHDKLVAMMLKSVFTKIMSTFALYKVVNLELKNNKEGTKNMDLHSLRTIYGGADDFSRYSPTPETNPELTELYIRLFIYGRFYKELFFSHHDEKDDNRHLTQGAAKRRMALLPEVGGNKFDGVMRALFLRDFKESKKEVDDLWMREYVDRVNELYKATSSTDKTQKILEEFIQEVNRRYGVVMTDDIKAFMQSEQKKKYTVDAQFIDPFDKSKSFDSDVERVESGELAELLDGEGQEDKSIVPSDGYNSFYRTRLLYLMEESDKDKFNFNDLQNVIYNFRKKLDDMTSALKYEDAFGSDKFKGDDIKNADAKRQLRSGLRTRIMSVKRMLESKRDSKDKLTYLKDQLNNLAGGLSGIIDYPTIAYRELVFAPAQLIYKIMLRVSANVHLFGNTKENVPLNKNLNIYNLASVLTDLVPLRERGGKNAPELDFTNLKNTLQSLLKQVTVNHNVLKSVMSQGNIDRMNKHISLLIEYFKMMFAGSDDMLKVDYANLMYNPLVDYSEFNHVIPVNQLGGECSNEWMLYKEKDIYGRTLMMKHPLRSKCDVPREKYPDVNFDLFNDYHNPDNIYKCFDFVLITIYKNFFEKYGIGYSKLVKEIAEKLGEGSVKFNVNDLTNELGGSHSFQPTRAFSDKAVMLFKFLSSSDSCKNDTLEEDLTNLPKGYIDDLKCYLPLLMFLLKHIARTAAVHAKYISLDKTYDAKGDDGPFPKNNIGRDLANRDHVDKKAKYLLGGLEIVGGNASEINRKIDEIMIKSYNAIAEYYNNNKRSHIYDSGLGLSRKVDSIDKVLKSLKKVDIKNNCKDKLQRIVDGLVLDMIKQDKTDYNVVPNYNSSFGEVSTYAMDMINKMEKDYTRTIGVINPANNDAIGNYFGKYYKRSFDEIKTNSLKEFNDCFKNLKSFEIGEKYVQYNHDWVFRRFIINHDNSEQQCLMNCLVSQLGLFIYSDMLIQKFISDPANPPDTDKLKDMLKIQQEIFNKLSIDMTDDGHNKAIIDAIAVALTNIKPEDLGDNNIIHACVVYLSAIGFYGQKHGNIADIAGNTGRIENGNLVKFSDGTKDDATRDTHDNGGGAGTYGSSYLSNFTIRNDTSDHTKEDVKKLQKYINAKFDTRDLTLVPFEYLYGDGAPTNTINENNILDYKKYKFTSTYRKDSDNISTKLLIYDNILGYTFDYSNNDQLNELLMKSGLNPLERKCFVSEIDNKNKLLLILLSSKYGNDVATKLMYILLISNFTENITANGSTTNTYIENTTLRKEEGIVAALSYQGDVSKMPKYTQLQYYTLQKYINKYNLPVITRVNANVFANPNNNSVGNPNDNINIDNIKGTVSSKLDFPHIKNALRHYDEYYKETSRDKVIEKLAKDKYSDYHPDAIKFNKSLTRSNVKEILGAADIQLSDRPTVTIDTTSVDIPIEDLVNYITNNITSGNIRITKRQIPGTAPRLLGDDLSGDARGTLSDKTYIQYMHRTKSELATREGDNIKEEDTYSEKDLTTGNKEQWASRANSAMTYASKLYTILRDIYKEVADRPTYGSPDFDSGDLISEYKADRNLQTPLSLAVDSVPTYYNTLKTEGDKCVTGNVKSYNDSGRVGLGLHCCSPGELLELFMGPKSQLYKMMSIFLHEDKLHVVQQKDIPILDVLGKNVDLVSGITKSEVDTFSMNMGALLKYLYEIEMKDCFMTKFPVFNNVCNPKYHITTKTLGGRNDKLLIPGLMKRQDDGTYIDDVDISVDNNLDLLYGRECLKSEKDYIQFFSVVGTTATNVDKFLEIVNSRAQFGYDSFMFENATDLTNFLLLGVNEDNFVKYMNNNSQLSATGIVDGGKYNIDDGRIMNDALVARNILDVGIYPINIHAMMREIPMANMLNNNYSFDVIMKWLIYNGNERVLFDVAGEANQDEVYDRWSMNYMRDPLAANMVPIDPSKFSQLTSSEADFYSMYKMEDLGGFYKYQPIVTVLDANAAVTGNGNAESTPNVYGRRNDKNTKTHVRVELNGNAYPAPHDLGLALIKDIKGKHFYSRLLEKITGALGDNKTYRSVQSKCNIDAADLVNGVDPHCQLPTLAVQIYSELLFKTMVRPIKATMDEERKNVQVGLMALEI